MPDKEGTAEITSLPERLAPIVRDALLGKNVDDTLENHVGQIVTAVLAELCPPNHLLLITEAIRERDAGTNTPDGYEPACDYADLNNFTVLHDTVEDTIAGLLVFSADLNEIAPDGLGDLEIQISTRFQSQQDEVIRQAKEWSPFAFKPGFLEAERLRQNREGIAPATVTTSVESDRSNA
jgi:hypothetical protein